jgi:hypothetical protein
LPAAPGFIGNYHYARVVALGLFGVGKDTALAYSILAHFLTIVIIVGMGILYINVSNLKVRFSLRSAIDSEQLAVGSGQRAAGSGQEASGSRHQAVGSRTNDQ